MSLIFNLNGCAFWGYYYFSESFASFRQKYGKFTLICLANMTWLYNKTVKFANFKYKLISDTLMTSNIIFVYIYTKYYP